MTAFQIGKNILICFLIIFWNSLILEGRNDTTFSQSHSETQPKTSHSSLHEAKTKPSLTPTVDSAEEKSKSHLQLNDTFAGLSLKEVLSDKPREKQLRPESNFELLPSPTTLEEVKKLSASKFEIVEDKTGTPVLSSHTPERREHYLDLTTNTSPPPSTSISTQPQTSSIPTTTTAGIKKPSVKDATRDGIQKVKDFVGKLLHIGISPKSKSKIDQNPIRQTRSTTVKNSDVDASRNSSKTLEAILGDNVKIKSKKKRNKTHRMKVNKVKKSERLKLRHLLEKVNGLQRLRTIKKINRNKMRRIKVKHVRKNKKLKLQRILEEVNGLQNRRTFNKTTNKKMEEYTAIPSTEKPTEYNENSKIKEASGSTETRETFTESPQIVVPKKSQNNIVSATEIDDDDQVDMWSPEKERERPETEAKEVFTVSGTEEIKVDKNGSLKARLKNPKNEEEKEAIVENNADQGDSLGMVYSNRNNVLSKENKHSKKYKSNSKKNKKTKGKEIKDRTSKNKAKQNDFAMGKLTKHRSHVNKKKKHGNTKFNKGQTGNNDNFNFNSSEGSGSMERAREVVNNMDRSSV